MTDNAKILALGAECCQWTDQREVFNFSQQGLIAFYNRVREDALREAADQAERALRMSADIPGCIRSLMTKATP